MIGERLLVSELEKYRYHPGIITSEERPFYDRIKENIQEKGLKYCFELQYNPITGKARLAEGNHRLTLIKELGINIVPVCIRRNYNFTDGVEIPGAMTRVANREDHVPVFLSLDQVFPNLEDK